MLEVDTLRRGFPGVPGPFNSTMCAPPMLTTVAHPAFTTSGAPDKHVLLHYPQCAPNMVPSSKSDEEDDDDEYRPFTPPPPRERLSYTRYQLELLNAIYNKVRYPNSTQKQLVAKRVGITREQVKIWFQNRRRKDVIGGKSKSEDEGDRSSDKTDDDNNSNSGDSSCGNDSTDGSSVVPDVVMKSVIAELFKFQNDPLKGKKNKKKMKASKTKEKQLKVGLYNTLLHNYDMIAPPNQVTPSAFMTTLKSKFNHSKGFSAFESPRDSLRPPQCASNTSIDSGISVTSTSSNSSIGQDSQGPFTPIQSPPTHLISSPFSRSGHFTSPPGLQCELPVLSDLLMYKSNLDTRHKELSASVHRNPVPSTRTPQVASSVESHRGLSQNSISHLNRTPSLHGMLPFPFVAEQPMLLSSFRQPEQYRQYPRPSLPTYSEDPYQPLLITSRPNPYYSPSSTWSSSMPNVPTLTQL